MNAAVQLAPAGARRLKIAQVATSDISVRLLLLDQIEALERAGHEVIAICSPSDHMRAIENRGIRVETVPMSREPAASDFASLVSLARCFRRNRFDVVHTHTPKAGVLGPLAARMARVPRVVHTIHGLLLHDAQPRWRQALYWLPEKLTASACHRLLSQSREDVAAARAHRLSPAEKIEYLGNGVDVERFRPPAESERFRARQALRLRPEEFAIASVGRLVYEKGFGELFTAAAQIKARHPAARFFVVGPEERDQGDAIARARLQELGRSGAIEFLGWRDEMTDFYSALDAFVLASHREGLPRACMEAAASGLPVIASDIRGCREVVRHLENGLLFAPGDSEALAAAIAALIADPARARSMGERGRRLALQNFDQRRVLARLCSFYEDLAREIEAGRR